MQAKVNTMVCGLNNWHFCVFTPVSTDPWLLELFRICRIWINSQENLSGNSQNQVYTQETITERSCASAFESISHAFHHISPSTQFTGQRPSLPRCFGKRERPQEMMLVDWWDNGWFFRCSQANLDESGWNLIEAVSQKQKKTLQWNYRMNPWVSAAPRSKRGSNSWMRRGWTRKSAKSHTSITFIDSLHIYTLGRYHLAAWLDIWYRPSNPPDFWLSGALLKCIGEIWACRGGIEKCCEQIFAVV